MNFYYVLLLGLQIKKGLPTFKKLTTLSFFYSHIPAGMVVQSFGFDIPESLNEF
jgi:hypothetical protein